MNTLANISIEPFELVVDGQKIAGLVSGPKDGVRVLALHGWLDNAASFNMLAGTLKTVRLVALDLPGHGLSDHRSGDASYQIWDDLPQILGGLDQLGWDQCVMLGHSRGAMISTLLAASMPERVRALVTLDGLIPYPFEDEKVITQLRSYLLDRKKQSAKPLRVFESHHDFIERRARLGEPRIVAEQLAARNLRKTENGYAWRGDPRLSGASAIKVNKTQCETILKSLEMPVLNLWAGDDSKLKKFMDTARSFAQTHIENLKSVEIAGHHHWHMEAEPAAEIAGEIEAFLTEID